MATEGFLLYNSAICRNTSVLRKLEYFKQTTQNEMFMENVCVYVCVRAWLCVLIIDCAYISGCMRVLTCVIYILAQSVQLNPNHDNVLYI